MNENLGQLLRGPGSRANDRGRYAAERAQKWTSMLIGSRVVRSHDHAQNEGAHAPWLDKPERKKKDYDTATATVHRPHISIRESQFTFSIRNDQEETEKEKKRTQERK